jgi:Phosphoenolpyruvate carboxykinase
MQSSGSGTVSAGRDLYNVSQTVTGTDACRKVGIHGLGITGPGTVYRNLTYPQLFEHEVANSEGVVAKAEYGDTFTVDTGKYTGRSPKDRWIVLNPGSETAEHIDWNSINMATSPEVFDELLEKAVAYFNTRDTAYVFDGYCGADHGTRKKIRFVHEMAWQQHFGAFCSSSSILARLLVGCFYFFVDTRVFVWTHCCVCVQFLTFILTFARELLCPAFFTFLACQQQ